MPPFLEPSPARQGNKLAKSNHTPFPVSPKGERPGWEGDPHAAKKRRLPLQEGFQSALLKTPLLSPMSKPRHPKSAVGLRMGKRAGV